VRAHEDDPGAAFEHPLELGDHLLEDGQGDDGRGEDAVLVVEAPLLVQPLVDRVDGGVRQVAIVGEGVLDEVGDRREHQRALHAELIEELDSRARLTVRNDAVDRLARHLPERQAFGVGPRVEMGYARRVERRGRSGFGMYSVGFPFKAMQVRPRTSTNWMSRA
jgi:hypothetical protein